MSDFASKYGLERAWSSIILGTPGTGKSVLAGSVAEVVDPDRVLLLAAQPREASAWGYRRWKLAHTEVFSDAAVWAPDFKMYEAVGWSKLARRVFDLQQDEDHDAVILDPISSGGASDLIAHHILGPSKVVSATALANPYDFYTQAGEKLRWLVNNLSVLAHPEFTNGHPKWVFVVCHTQPPKDADRPGQGVRYEGAVMPALPGSYRETIAGDFDLQLYTRIRRGEKSVDPKTKKMVAGEPQYRMQVQADGARHAKVAVLPGLTDKDLPNNFREIYDRVTEERS